MLSDINLLLEVGVEIIKFKMWYKFGDNVVVEVWWFWGSYCDSLEKKVIKMLLEVG